QGDRQWLGGPAAPPTPRAPALVIDALDGYMRRASPRTAVVLRGVEDWLRYADAPRSLSDALARWAGDLRADNRNLCVLVAAAARDEVGTSLARTPQSALSAFLGRSRDRGVARIGEPEADELLRMVHRVRLRDGLRVAWGELDRVVAAMAAEQWPLRRWLAE